MTTFICPPQELPTEKVRQIVPDRQCGYTEDDLLREQEDRND